MTHLHSRPASRACKAWQSQNRVLDPQHQAKMTGEQMMPRETRSEVKNKEMEIVVEQKHQTQVFFIWLELQRQIFCVKLLIFMVKIDFKLFFLLFFL